MQKRRRFLKMIAAASVAGGATQACSDDGSDDGGSSGGVSGSAASSGTAGGGNASTFPEGFLDLGPVDSLPVGAVVAVPFAELFVGRDEPGVYAMNSRCTHKGCNMIDNNGVGLGGITECGCHGSRFDANGIPLTGPANEPLIHYLVVINEVRHVGINRDVEVDVNDRAAVPPEA